MIPNEKYQMMVRDKRDMRPLLLRFGVALALSFGGFLYSQLRPRRIRPALSPPSSGFEDHLRDIQTRSYICNEASVSVQKCEEASHQVIITDIAVAGLSSSSKQPGDEEGYLLPEFNELVLKEFEIMATLSPRKDVNTATKFRKTADKEIDEEIIHLRKMVQFLQNKERDLQSHLVKYHGPREQEISLTELQNRLKIYCMEAKLLNLKIESLQAENQRLEAKLVDYPRVMFELESSRTQIKLLKEKIRSNAQQNEEQFSVLQQRITNLQDQEQRAAMNDVEVKKEMQTLRVLEDELVELKRTNLILQEKNSELSRSLESTQILASSVLEDPESKESREMNHHLRKQNEDLMRKIEELQADRYTDAEELVYLRWINACLRYELRNYQPSPGKTLARDLSNTLSPKSEEKAKKLIIEYASSDGVCDKDISRMDFESGYWSSSQGSNSDSGEFDNSSFDTSSSSRTSINTKTKIFSKLKRLVLGKDSYNSTQVAVAERYISEASFEDLMGRFSNSTLSPKHNSSISEIPLAEIEAINGKMNKINLSQCSSIPSSNTQRLRRLRHLSLEDIRSVGMEKTGAISLHENNHVIHSQDTPEKLELMKYAEALKDSRRSRISHRKSASYSYF